MKTILGSMLFILLTACGKTSSSSVKDTIGDGDPNACRLEQEVINVPFTLCGSYGESPAFVRADFRVTYHYCPPEWKREEIRRDFIQCNDPNG